MSFCSQTGWRKKIKSFAGEIFSHVLFQSSSGSVRKLLLFGGGVEGSERKGDANGGRREICKILTDVYQTPLRKKMTPLFSALRVGLMFVYMLQRLHERPLSACMTSQAKVHKHLRTFFDMN
ncbi:hypothetical protein CDAR_482851 [Caerostris darwini]|uniref:Uncharacterized protein n=1 Tax=Caerostris darwini TaxID=1538125 RepID=A0AAV4UY32_9ARAC|nr:hypothetical protein CDAR_482851 [Caerostris darwini]